jgi:crotonobetaine/carnitine-CoA ligase
LTREDVLYCPFPLYHWDATVGTVMAALCGGCTAALARKFSVSGFWDDIRFFTATVFDFMGATLTFVYHLPEQDDDAHNPVRLAWGIPMPEFKADFERRFDLKLIEGYGSTEGGIAVFQLPGKTYPPGSCGEVAASWQLRLLDDTGQDVPTGAVGEIVTRPDDATQMMTGYLKMPEANAELIRNGWYFTGDLGRLDSHGNLYFAGRKKDVIRRRGENISALEIENVIEAHPAVAEVAAYGVPSKFSEEEVAVAIVLHSQATFSQKDLLAWCAGKMARYMVPEHILFLERLPRTATEKIAKAELKKRHAEWLSCQQDAG